MMPILVFSSLNQIPGQMSCGDQDNENKRRSDYSSSRTASK